MDVVLVLIPLTILVVAILQVAMVVFVRTTVVDALSEGARVGASADRSPADGAAYASDLIGRSLSPAYAGAVSAGEGPGGTVEVAASVPVPVLGVLTLHSVTMELAGHALREVP